MEKNLKRSLEKDEEVDTENNKSMNAEKAISGDSKVNKDVDTNSNKNMNTEDIKEVDAEYAKDVETEDAKDEDKDDFLDVDSEVSKDVDTEDSLDVDIEDAKNVDCLKNLPDLIFSMILKMLCRDDILSLSVVSYSVREKVKTNSYELQTFRRKGISPGILRQIADLGLPIKELEIRSFCSEGLNQTDLEDSIKYLLNLHPELSCFKRGYSWINWEITTGCFLTIISHSNMKTLHLKNVHLKNLHLTFENDSPNIRLSENLISLEVNGWTGFLVDLYQLLHKIPYPEKLKHLILADGYIPDFNQILRFTSLESLDLSETYEYTGHKLMSDDKISSGTLLLKMKCLNLEGSNLTYSQLTSLLRLTPNLNELNISYTRIKNNAELSFLVPKCRIINDIQDLDDLENYGETGDLYSDASSYEFSDEDIHDEESEDNRDEEEHNMHEDYIDEEQTKKDQKENHAEESADYIDEEEQKMQEKYQKENPTDQLEDYIDEEEEQKMPEKDKKGNFAKDSEDYIDDEKEPKM